MLMRTPFQVMAVFLARMVMPRSRARADNRARIPASTLAAAESPGLFQKSVDERGLAVIDVGDDCDISDVLPRAHDAFPCLKERECIAEIRRWRSRYNEKLLGAVQSTDGEEPGGLGRRCRLNQVLRDSVGVADRLTVAARPADHRSGWGLRAIEEDHLVAVDDAAELHADGIEDEQLLLLDDARGSGCRRRGRAGFEVVGAQLAHVEAGGAPPRSKSVTVTPSV